MSIVELEDGEWQTVLAMMSLAPWRDANPLLMKIGNQLRVQQNPIVKQPGAAIRVDGNNKEASQ
jgi:hypothetical protein